MAIIYGKIHYHGEMAEDVIDLKRVFKGIKKLFQWLFK